MIDDKIIARLKNEYPFLESLSPAEEQSIKSYSIHKVIPEGGTIFLKGDSCSFFAFVLRGRVRVFKTGETGREITLYRFQNGESCILTASCILSRNNFPAEAEAEEETETVLIPNELLREFVKQYEQWRSYFFDVLASRLSEVMEIIDEVAFRKMDERIADFLLKNSENMVIETTHRQIAAELGTSREVISRILKDFEKENLIKSDRGKIQIINPLQLKTKIHSRVL